ncbi:MAG TPA: hypothetical protein VLJ37_11535, partial [bacterium]|nr:hypothetical protein [bacterium]
ALDNLKQSLTQNQLPYFEQLAPFFECWHQMPVRDFYWEREWRFRGDFVFQHNEMTLGICPQDEIVVWEDAFRPIKFFDPVWGVDQIVNKLSR